MLKRRRHLAVLVIFSVVAAAGSFAYASASFSNSPTRVAFTSHFKPQAVTPVEPSAALNAILAKYGGTAIVDARIGSAPADYASFVGTWLSVTVAIPSYDERAIESLWEADLVQGALADSIGAPVIGTTVDGRLPDGGTVADIGGVISDVARDQNFGEGATNASIDSWIRSALTGSILQVKDVRVLHADQPAPVVIVSTDDPQLAAKIARQTIQTLFGQNPPRYEGYYFEIDGPDGKPVVIQAASFRSGAGHLWFTPTVASSLSLNHG